MRSGDWLDFGATPCQADPFDRALADRQSELGLENYIPCSLGEIADYYRRFIEPASTRS